MSVVGIMTVIKKPGSLCLIPYCETQFIVYQYEDQLIYSCIIIMIYERDWLKCSQDSFVLHLPEVEGEGDSPADVSVEMEHVYNCNASKKLLRVSLSVMVDTPSSSSRMRSVAIGLNSKYPSVPLLFNNLILFFLLV